MGQTVLEKMFVENTGKAMCDSGEYYGRNYERSQIKHPKHGPHSEFSVSMYGKEQEHIDFNYVLSTYHFCEERLSFESNLDRQWLRFANKPENKDVGWLQLMEQWVEERFHGEATGIYGDGDPFTVNSYNGSYAIDQMIQFMFFEYDGTEYYLLQIHGGCDVRGGYTTPRLFSNNGSYSELALFDFARGYIRCDSDTCDSVWDTDDGGYSWYGANTGDPDLKDCPVVVCDERPTVMLKANREALHIIDGKPICPCCQIGTIVA